MKKVSKVLLFLAFLTAFISVNLFVPTTIVRAEEPNNPAQENLEEEEEGKKEEEEQPPKEEQDPPKVEQQDPPKEDEEQNPPKVDQQDPPSEEGEQEPPKVEQQDPPKEDDPNGGEQEPGNQVLSSPPLTKGSTKVTFTIDNGTGIPLNPNTWQVTKGLTIMEAAAEANIDPTSLTHSEPSLYTPRFYVVPEGGNEIDPNNYVLNEDTTMYVRWIPIEFITRVNVTLAAPNVGDHVDTQDGQFGEEPTLVPDMRWDESAHFGIGEQKWIVSETDDSFFVGDIEEDTDYWYKFYVFAEDGYNFNDQTEFILNGSPFTVVNGAVIGKIRSIDYATSPDVVKVNYYMSEYETLPREVDYVVKGNTVIPRHVENHGGEVFLGWYGDEYRIQSFNFDNPITEETNIYAKVERVDGMYSVGGNDVLIAGFEDVDTNYMSTPAGFTANIEEDGKVVRIYYGTEQVSQFEIVKFVADDSYDVVDDVIYVNGDNDLDVDKISVVARDFIKIYRGDEVIPANEYGIYIRLKKGVTIWDDKPALIVSTGHLENGYENEMMGKYYEYVVVPENKYVVTFVNGWDETTVEVAKNGYIPETSFPNVDLGDGDILVGWYDDRYSDNATEYTTATQITGNVTLYPRIISLYSDDNYQFNMDAGIIYTGFKPFDIDMVDSFESGVGITLVDKTVKVTNSGKEWNFDVVSLRSEEYSPIDGTIILREAFDIDEITVLHPVSLPLCYTDDECNALNGYYLRFDTAPVQDQQDPSIVMDYLRLYVGYHGTGNGSLDVLDEYRLWDAAAGKYYVIFYNENGSVVSNVEIQGGDTVDNPGFVDESNSQENYFFMGWFSDPELTTPYDFSTPVTSDLELYIKVLNVSSYRYDLVDKNIIYTGLDNFDPSYIYVPNIYTKEYDEVNSKFRVKFGNKLIAEYNIVTLVTDYQYQSFNSYMGNGSYYPDGEYAETVIQRFQNYVFLVRDEVDFNKFTTITSGDMSLRKEPNLPDTPFARLITISQTNENSEEELKLTIYRDDLHRYEYLYKLLFVTPDSYFITYDISDLMGISATSNVNEVMAGGYAEDIFESEEGQTLLNGLNVLFGGWYTDSDLTQAFDFNTEINQDYTLYAKFLRATSKTGKTGIALRFMYVDFDNFDPDDIEVPEGYTKSYDANAKILNISKNNQVALTYDVIIFNTTYDHTDDTIAISGDTDFNKFTLEHSNRLTLLEHDANDSNLPEGNYLKIHEFDGRIIVGLLVLPGGDLDLADYNIEKVLQHLVSFETNGGTEVDPMVVNHGDKIQNLPVTDADNKVFVGWYSDQGLQTLFDKNTAINNDMTLYAKFDSQKVEITSSVAAINFGTLVENFDEDLPAVVTVKNTGNVKVTVTNTNPTGDGPFGCVAINQFDLEPGEDRQITYIANSSSSFAGIVGNYAGTYLLTATAAGFDDFVLEIPATVVIREALPGVAYSTHVESIGWQQYVRDGEMAGTSGKSLRLEAIRIKLEDQEYEGSIEYRTHIQNEGWETTYRKDDQLSGTSGKGLRLEAIQMRLAGEMADNYDIYYRVHAEMLGWLGWARNDEQSGTSGYGYRLEGIEIKLVPKGQNFDEYGKTFTFDDKVTGRTTPIPDNAKIIYTTHVESIGWQNYVSDGLMAGTSGKSLRLEGIKINLNNVEYTGDIEYRTHIQDLGWEASFKKNDQMSGTSGQSKRLEAIELKLTGEMADHYDVYYRVHAQMYGWLGWARNGEQSGTEGYGYRLEGIEIKLVEKGTIFNEYGKDITFASRTAGDTKPLGDGKKIAYTTHVESVGWQNYVTDGEMAGTSGKSLRLEGIKVKLVDQEYTGDIEYRTHIQDLGWEEDFKKNDAMSGTSGQSKRLEAIEIQLTGEMADHYDVYYRVHAQMYGWLDWAKNGEKSGTEGFGYRLEGIEIVLVEKGGTPPARSNKASDKAFIKR